MNDYLRTIVAFLIGLILGWFIGRINAFKQISDECYVKPKHGGFWK